MAKVKDESYRKDRSAAKLLAGCFILIAPVINAILISPSDDYYESPLSLFSKGNSSIFLGEDTLRYFSGAGSLNDISISNNILVEFIGLLANYTGMGWWFVSLFNAACLFYSYSSVLRAYPWRATKGFLGCFMFATPLLLFATASLNKEILLVCGFLLLMSGLRRCSRINVLVGLALLVCRPTDFIFGVYLIFVFSGFTKTIKTINVTVIALLFIPLNWIFTDEIRSSFFFQAFTSLDQSAAPYYNYVFSYASLPGSVAFLVVVNFGINVFSPLISETIRASFSVTKPLIEGVALYLTSAGSIIFLSKVMWIEKRGVLFVLFVWVFIHAIYPLNQFRYYVAIFPVIPLIAMLLSERSRMGGARGVDNSGRLNEAGARRLKNGDN